MFINYDMPKQNLFSESKSSLIHLNNNAEFIYLYSRKSIKMLTKNDNVKTDLRILK
jgi:hypothetical protein